jgi:hypothetical protein
MMGSFALCLSPRRRTQPPTAASLGVTTLPNWDDPLNEDSPLTPAVVTLRPLV